MSLGIPVAVMGVFFLMPAFDMTVNIISLLALIIVIGIIVDDGIIVAGKTLQISRKKDYQQPKLRLKEYIPFLNL